MNRKQLTIAAGLVLAITGGCGGEEEETRCIEHEGKMVCFEGTSTDNMLCKAESEDLVVCAEQEVGVTTQASTLPPKVVLSPFGDPNGISGCAGSCSGVDNGEGQGVAPPLSCVKCFACIVASGVTGGAAFLACGGSCIGCVVSLSGAGAG